MIDIAIQKTRDGIKPFSAEDWAKLGEYKLNQIIRCKGTGVKKERSYQQLKLYWACCRTVAENTEDPAWDTQGKVSFQCKIILHFVDPAIIAVRPDGTVQFMYRSISYDNLGHMDACRYLDLAFPLMAKKIGVKTEVLLREAK